MPEIAHTLPHPGVDALTGLPDRASFPRGAAGAGRAGTPARGPVPGPRRLQADQRRLRPRHREPRRRPARAADRDRLHGAALGAITAHDLARHRRSRGHSHFGLGFLLMAATCGPHHLVHATHLLLEGHQAGWPLLAALAIGFPPGAVFTLLRFEALAGGRGDRFVAGTPAYLAVLPAVVAAAGGATLLGAFQAASPIAGGWGWAGLLANGFLATAYLVTGPIVLRTPFARRPGLGGWSVSGVAMGGVFATCGASHLVAGLTTHAELHTLAFDLPGVPAAAFFLWVVHRLNRSSLNDWNRRPLVGRAARHGRPAPWSA